jgi:anti-anti-sigma factor
MAEPTRPDAVAPTRLEITTATVDDGTVLALSGELDIASAPALERTLDDLGPSLPGRLVIDLTEVTFMDSTGLRALLFARQRAADGDHELVLCPGPRQVQRVFELSGTLERFSFRDSSARA